jgi:hypothetical protein
MKKALIAVCLVLLAVPAAGGWMARRELSVLAERTASLDGPVQLELLGWRGGWLSSTARLQVRLKDFPASPEPFEVTLLHGPVSIGDLAHLRAPRLASRYPSRARARDSSRRSASIT